MRGMFRVSLWTIALSLGIAPVASAQSCIGVEGRVNVRTSELVANVTATITAATTTYTAQQILERQQILSALRVLGEQKEVSTRQEVSATEASAKALAQTIVEESTLSSIQEAAEEFGHTGYDACGAIERGDSLATAVIAARAEAVAVHDAVIARYGPNSVSEHDTEMQDWSQVALSAGDVSIDDVMDGDVAAAETFARLVLGPPTPPVGGDGTAAGLDYIFQMQDTARRSVVTKVIGDIAAEQAVSDQLDELTDTWIGEDGGQEWAASLAASPGRGALLDLARIEAANIAAAALELRRSMRTELALATFALTYTDRRVSDWNGLGAN